MNWILLSLLSALLLGFYEVSKKASVDNNAVLPVLLASSISGLALLVPVVLLSRFAPGLAARWDMTVAPLSGLGHLLVFAKAIIVTLSWVLTYFALKHLPISLASPVRASAPLFTLLGALLFFRERPSLSQWLGMACILTAYWGFSLIGRLEGIRFERNRWVWYLFAGTLVGAASGLYDKHLLQGVHISPMALQLWFTIYACLIQGIIVMVAWWPRHHATTPFSFRPSIVWVALLLILADAVYFRALSTPGALVSIVSTIRRSNVLISFVVGGLAFHESYKRRKALALLGVIAGIALLVK